MSGHLPRLLAFVLAALVTLGSASVAAQTPGSGSGAIEGRVREGARPELPVMASPATGPAAYDLTAYGPGEEPRPRDGEPTAVVHGELL